MKDIQFELIDSKSQWDIAKDIVKKHHSYVPHLRTVGRHVDFLIKDDSDYIGFIGIGSATYPPCKDVLTYLRCSKFEYKDRFNTIANNWRYCLVDNTPNLGTYVLKRFRQYSKYYWKQKYKEDLLYIMTFVGDGHDGAMYKADNWSLVGCTSGIKPHKAFSMKWNKDDLNTLFVREKMQEFKKLIFIKDMKTTKEMSL